MGRGHMAVVGIAEGVGQLSPSRTDWESFWVQPTHVIWNADEWKNKLEDLISLVSYTGTVSAFSNWGARCPGESSCILTQRHAYMLMLTLCSSEYLILTSERQRNRQPTNGFVWVCFQCSHAEDFADRNSKRIPWEKARELVRSCFFVAGVILAPTCCNRPHKFCWKAACQIEASRGTHTYMLAKHSYSQNKSSKTWKN